MTDSTQSEWAPSPGFWRKRPVAVTGATGLVGSHVVSLLGTLGAEVVILLRDDIPAGWPGGDADVSVVRGVVEDQAACERLFAEYGVVTAFHLAVQHRAGLAATGPVPAFRTNIAGTWSVLEAARASTTLSQMVVTSSDAVYGEQRAVPCTEDTPPLAVEPLEVSRAAADLLATSYARSIGLPLIIGRCPTVFGPGDTDWDRLVPGVTRALLENRRPLIRSDGLLSRDYLYVADAALSYLRLAEALAERPTLAGEAFNFSAERPMTVLELVEMLQIGCGTRLEPDVRALGPPQVLHRYLSAAKAHEVLGWRPHHTVEEAIILTIRWYRDHLDIRTPTGS